MSGSWTYDFSDPSGPQLGTIALPESDVMTDSIDPVAVITTNTALGIRVVQEVEVVVVIDRGDRVHRSDLFYAFKTPDNRVAIQWSDQIEPGYEVLGKVVLCTVPWVIGMKKQASGFLEDEDGDE